MTKTIGYTALHYGSDYLGYAIRSIIDYVDEYYVLYASQGSHGHRTDRQCPDSRHTLLRIAHQAAGDKLRWLDGEWPYEGAQRETIHQVAPDADMIIVLDADELWTFDGIAYAKRQAWHWYEKRTYRIPMVHFWRSFHKAILHDPAYPVRIIRPKVAEGEMTLSVPPIAHMGYAQRSEIVSYKLLTHGHKGEFRRDCDWLHEKFLANAQQDCHPVGSEYWNPEPVVWSDYLPSEMRDHPYWGLDVIP